MADVELVVKLPEALYNNIQNGCGVYPYTLVYEALKNGTPLPKGHGRLIDADSVYRIVRPIEASDAKWGMTAETAKRIIHDAFDKAPTIIEADKEEKQDEVM